MPNHTSNSLLIEGDNQELARFISAVTSVDDKGDKAYRIAQLVPMPSALDGTESPTPSSPEPHPNWAVSLAEGKMTQEWYDKLVANQVARYEAGQKAMAETGYYNWYDWANKVWGTKWGDYDTDLVSGELSADDTQIRFLYQTAWSPFSEGFFEKVSQLFPTLSFEIEYEGEGTEYIGLMVAENGVVKDFYAEPDLSSLYEKNAPDGDIDWDAYTEAIDRIRDAMMEELRNLA